jgi:hypothetical protein
LVELKNDGAGTPQTAGLRLFPLRCTSTVPSTNLHDVGRTGSPIPLASPSLKRAGLDSSLQVVFLVARHGWASLHRSCSCVSFHAAASIMALLRKPAVHTHAPVPCCSWLTRPHPWISVQRGAAGLCPFATIFVCCDAAIMHGLRPVFEALQKVYKICFVPDCDCCKKSVLQCRRFL